MSGSSAGNYVALPQMESRSDEDRELDEFGQRVARRVEFTLTLLGLATPEQKTELRSLVSDVILLASRERSWRHEARLKNNDAIRQCVAVGVYERKVETLEDESDKLRGQLTRLRSKFAVSMAPSLKGKKRAAKAK